MHESKQCVRVWCFVYSVLRAVQLCTGRVHRNSETKRNSSILACVSILTKGPNSPKGVLTMIWLHLFSGSVATSHRGEETAQWQGTSSDISVSVSLAVRKA